MLLLKGLIKFIVGIFVIGFFIFTSAGTFSFFNGRLFLITLGLPILTTLLLLFKKDKPLLEKRLSAKEKASARKKVPVFSALLFLSVFISSGISFRFSLLLLPKWVSILASILFLASYLLYWEVMRENKYLSRTVEIQKDQKVVSTGLYGLVRHPMYSVTILLTLLMPLILGGLITFIISLIYPSIIIMRLKDEEELLSEELEGYKEYKEKVKYRLFPFIW